jgi:PhnB protein
MAVKPVPDGFHTVTPYLVVSNVAKLIDFLKAAFGAVELYRMDMPDGSIGHAEVRIGDSPVMMGQAGGPFEPLMASLYLYVPDVDAVYKRAVQAGGTSIREPVDQFYGDRQGGVKDAFGNQWWIATHKEDVSHEELKKRAMAQGKQ